MRLVASNVFVPLPLLQLLFTVLLLKGLLLASAAFLFILHWLNISTYTCKQMKTCSVVPASYLLLLPSYIAVI